MHTLTPQSIHQHFVVDTKNEEVLSVLRAAQTSVNELWHNANLPKYIQFGKDDRGTQSHAADGPTMKAVMAHPTLLKQTMDLMQPVYALLQTHALTPELTCEAEEGAPPEK